MISLIRPEYTASSPRLWDSPPKSHFYVIWTPVLKKSKKILKKGFTGKKPSVYNPLHNAGLTPRLFSKRGICHKAKLVPLRS